MRVLTSKYWKKFKKIIIDKEGKKRTVRDGTMFEDLVQEILDLEYGPNRWKRTGESWDGSRDFEWRTAHSYKWAECKNYEDKISLNVLSNTLVMALIDFADEVLIFSYSKIKEPVLNKIIQYADISQKKIKIYADESLEDIILSHFSDLQPRFFPSANIKEADLEYLSPYISCQIIADPVIAYTSNTDLGVIPKSPSEINFDTLLCLNIYVFNRTSRYIAVEATATWAQGDFLLLSTNKRSVQKFMLTPNSIIVKKIYFRALKYAPILRFPDITIICGAEEKKFSFKSVKCSWIGDCMLQGSSYKIIQNIFKMKVVNGRFFRAINFYGTSGVGKSRLLKECENIALSYNFRIIRFQSHLHDKELNSVRTIITEFICGIYDIPNLEEALERSQDRNLSGIYQILYDIKHKNNFLDNAEQSILPIIIRKLQRTYCYISIDNIQYYPEAFISFLHSIIQGLLTENNPCKSRIGISFNMDYISQQRECTSFWDFLCDNKNYIISEEITGFMTEGETKLFLNQLLHNLDIEPEQEQMIVKVSNGNPFYVKSYLKLLETENIIVPKADGYIIPSAKQEAFVEKMNCIPKDIFGILENRWNYYLKNHNEIESLQILGVLHIFQELNNVLIQKFCLSEIIINELYKFHFLIRQNRHENIYIFEHDLMEMYLAKRYFPLCKYTFSLKNIPQNIDHEWYNSLYIIIKKNVKSNLINCHIVGKEPPYKIGYEIFTLWMIQVIQQIDSIKVLENNLQNMIKVCETTREIYGTDATITLYKKIINMIKTKFNDYQTNMNWAWVMISYCNLLYERNLYQEAITEIKNLLTYWTEDKITVQNRIIYAYFYNRLHVYHRAIHKCVTVEVLNWLEKSEKLQDASDSPVEVLDEIKFINLVDRGYCNYENTRSKKNLLTAWKQACEIYENGRIVSKKMNYLFAKMQISLLQNNIDSAKETIKEGLNAIDTKAEGTYYFLYFKQRYLLCQIICLLLDNQYRQQEIADLFAQIEDYNYILKSRISYSVQWLKSIYYFHQKKYVNALMCIQSAYYSLYENKKKTFQLTYSEQLCSNVCYFLAEGIVDNDISADMIQLTEQKLVSLIKEIFQMPVSELRQFVNNCQATSVLQDSMHKINFPTI